MRDCAPNQVWYIEGRGCGRERTHLREKQGACLSAAFLPQFGQSGRTLLHFAASEDNAALVEQLLAAGGNKEAEDEVRGDCGVEDRKGSRGNTQFFLLSLWAVSFWFRSRL